MERVILKVENGQPVVSSKKIADNFGKRHSHVVEAIENKIKSLTTENSEVEISKLFIPTTFNHNGNDYKEYLLTRDGFTFIVMGFTGAKADSWKLKYIEAFNKIEQYIKEKQKPKCIEDVLIQSLQEMKDVKYQLETVKKESKETKEEVQAIRDVITINPKEEWRKETNKLISKICYKLQDYKTPKDEIYRALEERAKCKLSIRLKNLQGRAALNGMSQSQIDKLNNLDVIANDVRLKEIYISIVSQMAIKMDKL
ncbi:MAG: Rha family transcriptional regulator [Clostridium sporogenes]|nr:Rha family transcriptional regulator [Clostridium sporogenes]